MCKHVPILHIHYAVSQNYVQSNKRMEIVYIRMNVHILLAYYPMLQNVVQLNTSILQVYLMKLSMNKIIK